jgi:murein DD-endopeptidase MepM/ murein hydrolase activator NlpD
MLNFKKIKSLSLILVPEATSRSPRSYKISFKKLLLFLFSYSLIVFILGFYIISFTPFSESLFPYSLRLSSSDKKKIEILNNKVLILAKEIESLKSLNQKLKFAIMLGDSTLIDKEEIEKDSLKRKSSIEGNLFGVVIELFNDIFHGQTSDITFIKPAQGFISQKYDPDRGHFGIDYVLKDNSPVFSSAGGYVVFASYTTDYGYTIIISHSDNYITKYMHCSSLLKKEGDIVLQGELIALSGNSGTQSSGPHLHFEIWKDGKPINPVDILTNN